MHGIGVRNRYLGILGGWTRTYFQTSSYFSYFRFIDNYVFASGFDGGWSSASKPPSQVLTETCGSDISYSVRVSGSGSNCVSGTTLIPRPSRARDLVIIAEVGSTRLTSLEGVTTGAGSVSRGARAKSNLLGRSL